MKYNPDLHHRRSIRLRNHDYANAGAYFITICCQNHISRFGKIVAAGSACPNENTMSLNEFGKIVDAEWKNLTIKYPNVKIGEYVIMPNHFHGIIEIAERGVNIGNIIGFFKYNTTKMINLPEKLWQRNYWEHIIRNEADHARIAKYIRNNPISWGKKYLNKILPQQP